MQEHLTSSVSLLTWFFVSLFFFSRPALTHLMQPLHCTQYTNVSFSPLCACIPGILVQPLHCMDLNCFVVFIRTSDHCVVCFFLMLKYYIQKSLCVVSKPYGVDLHCHRHEALTAFFSLGHMACVGVCLCVAGSGVWPLIVTPQHHPPV